MSIRPLLPAGMTSYFEYIDPISTDEIKLVDLRSPSEFTLGAMPGAINLPLFDDVERAEVGTIYKQTGKIEAVQRGLEIVATKIPDFLNQLYQLAGNRRRILLHCWRGGMRSGSVAKMLRYTGVDAKVLTGGYKEYRKQVLGLIDKFADHPKLVLIGRTGSGKTQLLRKLKQQNLPVIDLEWLAMHRGSAFGDIHMPSAQPTQQNFENQLASDYFKVRQHRLIAVEIEQNIGQIHMPAKLRTNVYASPMVLVERSVDSRVNRLVEDYAPNWNDVSRRAFIDRLEMLRHLLSTEIYQNISAAIQSGQLQIAARLMLEHRYDKVYDKGIARRTPQIVAKFDLDHNEDVAISEIAKFLNDPETWFSKIQKNI
jgi:tRNA 2-selenouridine synthase